MKSNKRNLSIDLIRGISILYIVGFWHLMDYTNHYEWYQNSITTRVTVFVLSLFVMISGYLIGLEGGELTKNNIISFYKNKFVRIYPPYLIAVLCFILLGIGNRIDLIKSIFAFSIVYEPSPPTLWFVTMLIPFYILSPFLVHLSSNLRHYFVFTLWVVLSMLLYEYLFETLDIRITLYFLSFSVGILIPAVKDKLLTFSPKSYVVASLLALLISYLNMEKVEYSLFSMPLAVFPALSILVFSMEHKIYTSCSDSIIFLSTASYFMYLFHRPLFHILMHLCSPKNELFQGLYLIFFCLPVIVLFSWVGQKTYNKFVQILITDSST